MLAVKTKKTKKTKPRSVLACPFFFTGGKIISGTPGREKTSRGWRNIAQYLLLISFFSSTTLRLRNLKLGVVYCGAYALRPYTTTPCPCDYKWAYGLQFFKVFREGVTV